MATRKADRTLQRCWMARVRSASLTASYTTNRDTTSFAKDDCLRLGLAMGLSAPSSAPSNKGRLPANATQADKRDEEFAHKAAEMVRSGMGLADAIRQTAPSRPMLQPASVERGVRRVFGLMYDRNGNPL